MSPRRRIGSHEELDVYQLGFKTAMRVFEISKRFPREERYSLTDQIRRSSRSVCANTTEAWRKRRYVAAFISKLSDAEAEAAETQTWISFAAACGYLLQAEAEALKRDCDLVIGKLVVMIRRPEDWVISSTER